MLQYKMYEIPCSVNNVLLEMEDLYNSISAGDYLEILGVNTRKQTYLINYHNLVSFIFGKLEFNLDEMRILKEAMKMYNFTYAKMYDHINVKYFNRHIKCLTNLYGTPLQEPIGSGRIELLDVTEPSAPIRWLPRNVKAIGLASIDNIISYITTDNVYIKNTSNRIHMCVIEGYSYTLVLDYGNEYIECVRIKNGSTTKI